MDDQEPATKKLDTARIGSEKNSLADPVKITDSPRLAKVETFPELKKWWKLVWSIHTTSGLSGGMISKRRIGLHSTMKPIEAIFGFEPVQFMATIYFLCNSISLSTCPKVSPGVLLVQIWYIKSPILFR